MSKLRDSQDFIIMMDDVAIIIPPVINYVITTEGGDPITTESGDILVTEQ